MCLLNFPGSHDNIFIAPFFQGMHDKKINIEYLVRHITLMSVAEATKIEGMIQHHMRNVDQTVSNITTYP